MSHSRYLMTMDKIDRWCHLLGTVLVKVSFVDPDTGMMVKQTEGGKVQLDVMHGGIYDLKHGASPYYMTELLIGFGNKFGGFANEAGSGSNPLGSSIASGIPDPSSYGINDATQSRDGLKYRNVREMSELGRLNRIYWSPASHVVVDEESKGYKTTNPYGVIPAVPFFDMDPAHYYFLPINEPLVYANHTLNMRITDLCHIAKFQSFGVPVVKGVERPTSTRQGRPTDDFNNLKGGSAQSRFGGVTGFAGITAGGQFRTYDTGFGLYRDGNADANMLGFSLGPDTAVAVGEKGDFKFAHPSADITGLIKAIHSLSDVVRINHGLRPKYEQSLPSSGFAMLMEKIGVLDQNIRRARLFMEREQQLFQVIKRLWNTHHSKSGDKRFSDDARLEITYKAPEFPVDPKVKKEDLMMEQTILNTADTHAIKKLYPYMGDDDVSKLIKERQKDRLSEAKFEAKMEVEKAKILTEAGIFTEQKASTSSIGTSRTSQSSNFTAQPQAGNAAEKTTKEVAKPRIDNRAKHATDSSKQGSDPRKEK